jgi:hypothetical protein
MGQGEEHGPDRRRHASRRDVFTVLHDIQLCVRPVLPRALNFTLARRLALWRASPPPLHSTKETALRKKRTWFARVRAFARKSVTYLEEVPGSLSGHLNREELVRVSVTALAAGGGLFGLLQALALSAGTIFPAPTDAALAAAVLTAILEVLRRLTHGKGGDKKPEPPRASRWSEATFDRKDAHLPKARGPRGAERRTTGTDGFAVAED